MVSMRAENGAEATREPLSTSHYSDIFYLRCFDGPITLSGAIEWRWVGEITTKGDSWSHDHS